MKLCEACHKKEAIRVYCFECGVEIRKQKKRDWVKKHKHEASPALPCKGIIEIIEDALPVDKGGFRPGTRFDAVASERMVYLKVLTEGTIVKAGGLLYKISYKQDAYK